MSSRTLFVSIGTIVMAVIVMFALTLNAITRTSGNANSGTALAGENVPVIDLPPGEKVVDASWAHSPRFDSIATRVRTRRMKSGEEAETYTIRTYLSSESEPRSTHIIREHAPDEKK